MEKPSAVIAIPFYGDVDTEFVSSLVALEYPGAKNSVKFVKTNRVGIAPARDILAQAAIDFESPFLLFIDSDMVFDKESLIRLWQRMKDPAIAIVGALAHKRIAPFEACIFRRVDDGWKYCDVPTVPALYEVDAIGMAFTFIRTKVFADLEKPYFRVDPEGKREDLNFCLAAKNAGHRIFVDTTVQVGHLSERVVVDNRMKNFNDQLKNGIFIS